MFGNKVELKKEMTVEEERREEGKRQVNRGEEQRRVERRGGEGKIGRGGVMRGQSMTERGCVAQAGLQKRLEIFSNHSYEVDIYHFDKRVVHVS